MQNTSQLKDAHSLSQYRKPLLDSESEEYTKARRELLAKEIELRRQMTELSRLRQNLPAGPVIEKDYKFMDENGLIVSLNDLFGEHKTLITYFWMYGPERKNPCPMCTNWLGGVNGNAVDIKQKAAFKILGRSPVSRQMRFAIERGWKHLDFVQTMGDDYAKDFKFLNDDKTENPGFIVYKKDGNKIRVFYSLEMPMEAADPGQDPRTAPDIAPLWNILDLTPEGRGTDWYPKLSY